MNNKVGNPAVAIVRMVVMHGPFVSANTLFAKANVLPSLLRTTASLLMSGNLSSGLCDASGLLGRRTKTHF